MCVYVYVCMCMCVCLCVPSSSAFIITLAIQRIGIKEFFFVLFLLLRHFLPAPITNATAATATAAVRALKPIVSLQNTRT